LPPIDKNIGNAFIRKIQMEDIYKLQIDKFIVLKTELSVLSI